MDSQKYTSACFHAGSNNRSDSEGYYIDYDVVEVIPIDCDEFSGSFLFLQRPEKEDDNHPCMRYFKGKRRLFEWRVQGVFKRDPGDLYFAAEFLETPSLSWTMGLTVSWLLSIASMLSAARGVWFNYSLEKIQQADGSCIRPHLAYPMIAADGIYKTPSHETPPDIAGVFQNTSLSERQAITLDTEHTFTFIYYSQYVNFRNWEFRNLPLGWSSSLQPFVGDGPLHFTAYSLIKSVADGGQHSESNKSPIICCVFRPDGDGRDARKKQESRSRLKQAAEVSDCRQDPKDQNKLSRNPKPCECCFCFLLLFGLSKNRRRRE